MPRVALFACVCLLVLTGLMSASRLWYQSPEPADDMILDLPVPPFPPRITDGSKYESCLASLAENPPGALAIAEAWEVDGGGEGARHCKGLAIIALGNPEKGAETLEQLAQQSVAPPLARASVLGQAVQARMMFGQADRAQADATAALALSPSDTELLIMRATARSSLGDYQSAVDDLNAALRLDGSRTDALVSRAVEWRKMGRLDLAQADVTQALAVDSDDPDALLERGILRQRTGDRAGAQADWEHARGADPNSTTADLASQNLALLEAGPRQQ